MSNKKKTPRPEPESLNLPLVGVETHAHLDMEAFEEDMDTVLGRARRSGVAHCVNVFLGPDAYERNATLFDGHGDVSFLLGVHPHEASQCSQDCMARMEAIFRSEPRLKGLGETGLDYFYDHSPRPDQQQAFRDQLALSKELDTPPVIHCRDAFEDALSILLDMGFSGRPLLWHCFGGDTAMAETILAQGWTISIPGPVSFPKSTGLRAAVAAMDLQRMVLETDCPFLTPAPYRGKRNEPAYLVFTAAAVAALKEMPVEQIWETCGNNARTFFGIASNL